MITPAKNLWHCLGACQQGGTVIDWVMKAEGVSFRHAVETRDLQGLLDVLAPEVVLISDGGGVKQAAPRPITGADKAARFIVGGLGKAQVALTGDPTVVNGNPALVLRVDGEIDGVVAIRVEDARISGLYYVRNPRKLTRIAAETSLTLR